MFWFSCTPEDHKRQPHQVHQHLEATFATFVLRASDQVRGLRSGVVPVVVSNPLWALVGFSVQHHIVRVFCSLLLSLFLER